MYEVYALSNFGFSRKAYTQHELRQQFPFDEEGMARLYESITNMRHFQRLGIAMIVLGILCVAGMAATVILMPASITLIVCLAAAAGSFCGGGLYLSIRDKSGLHNAETLQGVYAIQKRHKHKPTINMPIPRHQTLSRNAQESEVKIRQYGNPLSDPVHFSKGHELRTHNILRFFM